MTSRDEALRALEKKWRDTGDNLHAKSKLPYAAESDKMHNLCEGDLAHKFADELAAILSARQEVAPVAWLIRDRKTKVVWMDENSHFGSESEATICAMDMNDEIDDADFEAFAVYTSPAHTSEARDVARLDWLERFTSSSALLLHNGEGNGSGFTGIGLKNTNRTLRQAIDAAMRQEAGDV